MSNALESILGSMREAQREQERSGMFSVSTVNEAMREAAAMPAPRPLFKSLWYEGEMCCLFADSNLGKSVLAVQIADHIAKDHRVIYFDLELSAKQFQARYTDDVTGTLYNFSPLMFRAEINPESITAVDDWEDEILRQIESTTRQCLCEIVIMDNLTWLCSNSEKGDAAGRFMMRLQALKMKHMWSILVVAHTPKRPQYTAITPNDLAGSKRLYNFFDSVFALGSVGDAASGQRYLKQLKARYTEITYGAGNVIVYQLVKEGAWLHLEEQGFANEAEMLSQGRAEAGMSDDPSDRIREMHSQGMTQQEIVARLSEDGIKVSQSKVSRILRG